MRKFLAGLALAMLLVGCGQQQQMAETSAPADATRGYAMGGVDQGSADEERNAVAAPEAAPAPPPVSGEAPQGPQQPLPTQGGTNSPVLYLAYAYQVSFELPANHVTDVVNAHVQACQTAGPRLCQLV